MLEKFDDIGKLWPRHLPELGDVNDVKVKATQPSAPRHCRAQLNLELASPSKRRSSLNTRPDTAASWMAKIWRVGTTAQVRLPAVTTSNSCSIIVIFSVGGIQLQSSLGVRVTQKSKRSRLSERVQQIKKMNSMSSQVCRLYNESYLQNLKQEEWHNKTAQPQADKSPTSHFSPFNCCLSVVL